MTLPEFPGNGSLRHPFISSVSADRTGPALGLTPACGYTNAVTEALGPDRLRAADSMLRRRFGGRPRIASHEALAGRANVFRCRLEGAGAPASVVLKTPRLAEGQSYSGRDLSPGSPGRLLTTEWAGLELLDACQSAAETPGVSPRFFGADLKAGIVLVEDLGDGTSLADALLGDDAGVAEAALVSFARSLGRMHAVTAGHGEDYQAILDRLGRPRERQFWDLRLREEIAKVPATFEELDFEWSPGLVDDVQQIAAAMLAPGPFEAYIHGDPCPDNGRLIDGRMVFFDFERGAFYNAMVDGAYGRVPFPTCWCVNRLPAWLVTRFENAYRLELIKGVPAAGDDETFDRGLIEAAGWWLLKNANDLLPRALRFEQRWGISTNRQRLLYRFEVFAQASARFHQLEALGAWAYVMGQRLRAKWPEVQDMPLYPAFRDQLIP